MCGSRSGITGRGPGAIGLRPPSAFYFDLPAFLGSPLLPLLISYIVSSASIPAHRSTPPHIIIKGAAVEGSSSSRATHATRLRSHSLLFRVLLVLFLLPPVTPLQPHILSPFPTCTFPAMAAANLRLPPPAPAPRPAPGADLPPHLAFSANPDHGGAKIGNAPVKLAMIRRAPLVMFGSVKRRSTVMVEGTRDPSALTRELTEGELQRSEGTSHEDPFQDLRSRFLRFKKRNCVDNPDQFHNLAEAQSPKFMVIACADSRVCPSNVLGFQPGEAFTVRNVANLVPPFQHGPSETNAALEFAVNSLEVGNILVVGHSRCGGIQALMSMKEGADSSFIKDWVSIGKSARLSTKAAAGNQSFEMQCKHCEKESINGSLLNLLTYPWIERRVIEGKLSIHGGYYDFVNCTFEKWTLVYREGMEGGSKFGIKDRVFWS